MTEGKLQEMVAQRRARSNQATNALGQQKELQRHLATLCAETIRSILLTTVSNVMTMELLLATVAQRRAKSNQAPNALEQQKESQQLLATWNVATTKSTQLTLKLAMTATQQSTTAVTQLAKSNKAMSAPQLKECTVLAILSVQTVKEKQPTQKRVMMEMLHLVMDARQLVLLSLAMSVLKAKVFWVFVWLIVEMGRFMLRKLVMMEMQETRKAA
jgi:hypothetical protein